MSSVSTAIRFTTDKKISSAAIAERFTANKEMSPAMATCFNLYAHPYEEHDTFSILPSSVNVIGNLPPPGQLFIFHDMESTHLDPRIVRAF